MGVSDHQAYLDLLRELSGYLDRLGELSEQKAQTVRQDDLLAMDEVMKQEQVLSLSLRGLEQRRVKLLAQLGLGDVPLADLPGKYPAELHGEAKQTVEGLRSSYKIFRARADMARNVLELNLHQIEKVISAAGVDPNTVGAGYEPPGSEIPKNMKTDFRA